MCLSLHIMYELQGLQDYTYLLLYATAALLSVTAAMYFMVCRKSVFVSNIRQSGELRWWSSAFFIAIALSHVWWVVLGKHCLIDDRMIRNYVAITLDSITLVPLMMALLLRMLQDRRRPLWPIAISLLPILFAFIVCAATRNDNFEPFVQIYLLAVAVSFVTYMVFAVKRYGRWLHYNYADLEHKELWQSFTALLLISLIFIAYKMNYGGVIMEYTTQINTLILIAFITWRVETLQQLDPYLNKDEQYAHDAKADMVNDDYMNTDKRYIHVPSNIGALLKEHCENKELYLRHDLTLSQLCTAIGTNRTYLSAYFSQHNVTYNAYINRLRIMHFIHLYSETDTTMTAQKLAQQSGFVSYSTFSNAFKMFMGETFSKWVKRKDIQKDNMPGKL